MIDVNPPKIVALKRYSTHFNFEGRIYFIIFCTIHVLKCIRNNLIRTSNHFKYPAIYLPDGHSIPAGICDIQLIRQLYKEVISKKTLLHTFSFPKKVAWPNKLEPQQVHPCLILFSENMIMALCCYYPVVGAGTYNFLQFIQKYFVLLLLEQIKNKISSFTEQICRSILLS